MPSLCHEFSAAPWTRATCKPSSRQSLSIASTATARTSSFMIRCNSFRKSSGGLGNDRAALYSPSHANLAYVIPLRAGIAAYWSATIAGLARKRRRGHVSRSLGLSTSAAPSGGSVRYKPEGVWPIHVAPFQSILVHRPTITPLVSLGVKEAWLRKEMLHPRERASRSIECSQKLSPLGLSHRE